MRSVNRIRFNSMLNEVEFFFVQEKFCSKRNFRFCFNLDKMVVVEEEVEDQMSRLVSITFKQLLVVNLLKVGGIKDLEGIFIFNIEVDIIKVINVIINLIFNVVNNIACQKVDVGSDERERDIISLLRLVLVLIKVVVCQRCSVQCLINEFLNKLGKIIYENIMVFYQ